MHKKLAVLAGIVVVLVAAVLAYAATQPDTFSVQRSASIKASPEEIFPLINDLRRFASWSPYEEKDPDMKRTYSDTTSGTGASYEWDGDKNVGAGRLEIADATPSSKVTMNLNMARPFEVRNTVDFTLEPAGEATKVTWAMQGAQPYLAKVMCLFFNMDEMVGKDFEAGLAKLKEQVEQ